VCLAIPMRIVSIEDGLATIEAGGLTQRAALVLVPEAAVGDYVLVHAGYAITVLDAEEAAERERLFDELLRADAEEGAERERPFDELLRADDESGDERV
jgi:hydrogenase expression/formation protein HypC